MKFHENIYFFLELPPQSIFKDIIIKIKIHKNQDLQKFPIEDVPRLPKLLVGLSSYTSYETQHDELILAELGCQNEPNFTKVSTKSLKRAP